MELSNVRMASYPNPAPATVRILEGFPVEMVDEPFELVTPTGAAFGESMASRVLYRQQGQV